HLKRNLSGFVCRRMICFDRSRGHILHKWTLMVEQIYLPNMVYVLRKCAGIRTVCIAPRSWSGCCQFAGAINGPIGSGTIDAPLELCKIDFRHLKLFYYPT